MFRFLYYNYLYFLILIPVLIFIYIIIWLLKKKTLKNLGDLSIIMQLMPEISFIRPAIKYFLLLVGLVLIIIALARPQAGSKLRQVKREGIEIIVVLDVSNSMLADDIKPNRLENAKRAIERIINKMEDDKFGLIIFAGDAYTQIPITTDYASAKLFLSSIGPGIVSKQGTAMGAAIELATKSFSPDTEVGKVIIIITDGENHEDNPVDAAAKAAEKGIVIHTVGMGSIEGSPIPIERGSDFRKDQQGSVVISRLDETTLMKVATTAKGMYVLANNSTSALNSLFAEMKKMNKKEFEAKVYSEYDERYQYYIGFALLILFLEIIILERKNRILKNIKLFSTNFTKI